MVLPTASRRPRQCLGRGARLRHAGRDQRRRRRPRGDRPARGGRLVAARPGAIAAAVRDAARRSARSRQRCATAAERFSWDRNARRAVRRISPAIAWLRPQSGISAAAIQRSSPRSMPQVRAAARLSIASTPIPRASSARRRRAAGRPCAAPVPRSRNSGAGSSASSGSRSAGASSASAGGVPAVGALRRQQQRRDRLRRRPRSRRPAKPWTSGPARPAGSRSNLGAVIAFVARPAPRSRLDRVLGQEAVRRHPQPDQDRRGDVDRRIGADEDADRRSRW